MLLFVQAYSIFTFLHARNDELCLIQQIIILTGLTF